MYRIAAAKSIAIIGFGPKLKDSFRVKIQHWFYYIFLKKFAKRMVKILFLENLLALKVVVNEK
jgi:hypothetical protein